MNMMDVNDLTPVTVGDQEEGLPNVPQNWYIVASSKALKPGNVTTCSIGPIELALFRAKSTGVVTAFSAHCAHMGCHLKHACVVGENLRCALHYRHISPEGNFLKPNGEKSKTLIQKRYRVDERYGVVFVYLGDDTNRPPPGPDVVHPDEFCAAYAGSFRCEIPWHGLIANGCDMEHLLSVHERRLKSDPSITRPTSDTFKIAYNTAVTGTTLADRIMKWMSNDDINGSMTVICGTTIMVQSFAGPSPSIIMLSMLPQKDGGTLVHGIVGMKAKGKSPINILKLTIAKWLFKSFLNKDFGIFDGLKWHPPKEENSMGDRFSLQLYRYFKSLKSARTDDI